MNTSLKVADLSIMNRLVAAWNKVAPVRYLLTVEGNKDMVKEFFFHMKSLRLDGGFTVIYSKRKKGSFKEVSNDIFYTHWKAAMDANIRFPGQTIAIFEDDCRPLQDSDSNYQGIQERLLTSLEYISKRNPKKWQTLNLGQLAAGPIFKVPKVPMVISSFPFSSQSYLINGYYLGKMLKDIKKEKWKFPWAVEGFLKVPIWRKLAIYPNVTKQCVIPRM